jgi:hypothetical protein
LRSFAETIASDPLSKGLPIIAVGALVSRLLIRQHPAWRALARFLIILTVLLLHGGIFPYQPPESTPVGTVSSIF